ncbi:hypothetical protein ACFV5J_23445 [Streptomyces zaomyceticus]|uniref:hypothetical protein n=1 Tax=Streptomyces zaomyceticus TaxID=68286 RepID=UPI0036548BF8
MKSTKTCANRGLASLVAALGFSLEEVAVVVAALVSVFLGNSSRRGTRALVPQLVGAEPPGLTAARS